MYKLLDAAQVAGDKLVVAPGDYEFQALGITDQTVNLQYLGRDGATWLNVEDGELTENGSTAVSVPVGSLGVRAVATAKGPSAWLLPLSRSFGG